MKRIVVLTIAILMVIGLVLPGCTVVAPSSAEGKEVTALAQSSGDVTTYEGDLIIDGYEEFIIEACTWIQKGNIYVRDHGGLIVRNATLQVSQTHLCQYEFKVEDFATLIM